MMSGGSSAKGLALTSLRLSRSFSTTHTSASLSARLRNQWRAQPQSQPPVAKNSIASTSSAARPSTQSQPVHEKPSSKPNFRRSSPHRKAALRALHRTNKQPSQDNASASKFVTSSDKGNQKESTATASKSADDRKAQAAAHQISIIKELSALDDMLDALQSKAFNIAQRIKKLELSSRGSSRQLEDTWGPDRLSPPPSRSNEDTWSAASAASAAAAAAASGSSSSSAWKQNDKRSDEPKTRLVFGNDLLAGSRLRWRDGKGKPVANLEYSGPFADEQKKWNESVTGCLSSKDIAIDKVAPLRKMEVATLAHGLDRVLFNPGIYWLRDPRSGIYNFDPRIKDILDVDLFDYAALPPYITSSKDPELATLTQQHAKKYCGSTSSMTSLLSQCYFFISGWREPDTTGFSAAFARLPSGYSVGAKLPASIILNYKHGFYAIDADKTSAGEAENSNYVLTSLGKSMEKMLTATPEEYAKYMRINSWKLSEEEKSKPEAYHYASTPKIMMRSQLDCHDERLPRKTFDLKTRASIGIRNDRANYVEGSGYQIRRNTGVLESFEREYFDMIRAAFLKYNFQARIGDMDGIFVAYHTTSTIFGFQYISVEEMNQRLFGSEEMAEQAFKLSLGLMERVLDAATAMFPESTLKITVDTNEKSDTAGMVVYVEPAQPKDEDKRTIAQLDITVDRYLDGGLMLGPVDFSFLPGRRVDPMCDDEIERRMRGSLPPVRWEIDYAINPRPGLTQAKIRSNLDSVRARQASLSSLILPNVDALNEREAYRTQQLSQNPEALKRFLDERASGVAAGMPLAPGQLFAEKLAHPPTPAPAPTAVPDDVLAAAKDHGDTNAKSLRRKQAESRFVRMRNARTLRLRELAKLGAKDAKDNQKLDKLVMFQPRS